MSNRTWRLILTGLVTGLLGLGVAFGATASADPITCPGDQVSVKTADGWSCQNPAGNLNMSEDPRSPQADKSTF